MALSKNFHKWDIVIVNLDPTKGSEIRKIRPCIIISPNTINNHLNTVFIAPLTSSNKGYPSRIKTKINNVAGEICLDQIKSIDKGRILKIQGQLDKSLCNKVTLLLKEMFYEDVLNTLT